MFVETIVRKELNDLERDINTRLADLERCEYEIVDVKYGCMVYYSLSEYSAMIIYK